MNTFKYGLIAFAAMALPLSGFAADSSSEAEIAEESVVLDATGIDLDEFRWLKRPVIVFADSPVDPAFVRQIHLLTRDIEELEARDVVLITDTDPTAESAIRTKLRPRGFMLALVGKDGQVKLRKPLPWSVRELSRTIDKMPMRQQEIQERRDSN